MGISLLLYSIHRLHSLKSTVPPPGKSGYRYELSNQLNTAVISYAPICVLQAGAFCIYRRFFKTLLSFGKAKVACIIPRKGTVLPPFGRRR